MKPTAASIAWIGLIAGCAGQSTPEVNDQDGATPTATPGAAKPSLLEARHGFVTRLKAAQPPGEAVPEPPPGVFRLVKYPSPVGELAAYLTPDPGDGRKHPAIIWITGGDCNSIGELWEPAPRDNDQTAAAYREAGIVLMFPSLRGGNRNPGRREGFLGEVDDVLHAVDYLGSQPYVDPTRVYLGGHSTGGTLAMLVAETNPCFRATFAFGPIDDIANYGGQFVYHEPGNPREDQLRSPGRWLDSARSPVFVIEGNGGNIEALEAMRAASTNPMVRFVAVPGQGHFSVLAPANEAIAAKILADTGPKMAITLSAKDFQRQGR